MPNSEFDDTAAAFAAIDREIALSLIRQYDKWTDENLASGEITQEEAWDCYFGLFHECEVRMFWSEAQRILKKIDKEKYDPFLSKNPAVLMIVRIRVASNKANSN